MGGCFKRKKNIVFGVSVKCLILTCLAFFTPVFLDARILQAMSLSEQRDKADLIVIAKPISVRETGKRSPLPNIWTQLPTGEKKAYMAVGIETKFEILVVLKGDDKLKYFVLHHFRRPKLVKIEINGPGLVSFDPKSRKQFLMFLKKESSGRYGAVYGQTDPDQSIVEIGH